MVARRPAQLGVRSVIKSREDKNGQQVFSVHRVRAPRRRNRVALEAGGSRLRPRGCKPCFHILAFGPSATIRRDGFAADDYRARRRVQSGDVVGQ